MSEIKSFVCSNCRSNRMSDRYHVYLDHTTTLELCSHVATTIHYSIHIVDGPNTGPEKDNTPFASVGIGGTR